MKKIDVLKHELVPEHVLLSKKEAMALLKRLGISPNQLPWILASDPAARAVGAKPGDILMIIRRSPTAGRTVTFRLVMPG